MGEDWIDYEPEGADYVPVAQWGKDHWCTFAYLETCCVDRRGIIDNARMRCNARLHRNMVDSSQVRNATDYPTILKGGETKGRHDDWSCVEDMARAGLITLRYRRLRPAAIFGNTEASVTLTDLGYRVAAGLRRSKSEGGSFATFEAPA